MKEKSYHDDSDNSDNEGVYDQLKSDYKPPVGSVAAAAGDDDVYDVPGNNSLVIDVDSSSNDRSPSKSEKLSEAEDEVKSPGSHVNRVVIDQVYCNTDQRCNAEQVNAVSSAARLVADDTFELKY